MFTENNDITFSTNGKNNKKVFDIYYARYDSVEKK
jgi:hypothetical protein